MINRTMRILILLLTVVMCGVPLAAQSVSPPAAPPSAAAKQPPKDINERFLDPDLKPEDWMERFEIESREVYASRKAITSAMKLEPGDGIADVGAGTGLFLKPFSKAVTDTGKVYAVDISPRLVAHMRKRVEEENLSNVEVVLSNDKSIKLPKNSVDAVFICDTYHHFEHYAAMLESIRNALRTGGQLVVVDFERIPGKTSEWALKHVRGGKEVFRHEIEEAGFRFTEEVVIPGFRANYFLRFRKP